MTASEPGDQAAPYPVGQLLFLFAFSWAYIGTTNFVFSTPHEGLDGWEFLQLADTIANHGRFAVSADAPLNYSRVPGYPLFIVLCNTLGPSKDLLMNLAIGQVTAASAACVAIGLLCFHLVHRRWLIPGGILFAVYGGTIFTPGFVTREALSSFWLYWGFLLVIRAAQSPTLWRSSAAGLIFACGAMCREELFAYALVSLGFLIWRGWPLNATGAKHLAGAVLGFILVVSPWVIRNVATAGKPLLLSTASGTELYAGNNPEVSTKGINYGMAPVLRHKSELDPFATDAHYRDQAIRFILSHPGETLRNAINKMIVYVSPHKHFLGAYVILPLVGFLVLYLSKRMRLRQHDLLAQMAVCLTIAAQLLIGAFDPQRLLAATGNYRTLIGLGLVGLWLGRKQWREHVFLAAAYLGGIAIAGAIIPQYRQRFVLDGVLCIYTSFALHAIYTRLSALASSQPDSPPDAVS